MFTTKKVISMKNTLLVIIGFLLFLSSGYSKNLTKVSRTVLLNTELLDVYIHNDLAFIPGGLGGLNIVNISDPANTVVVGAYKSQNCIWGRLYSWSVFENYAYGAGRECGIEIIDISEISDPQYVSNIGELNIRYEHTEVQGNYLYTARHQAGIEIFSLTNPQIPVSIGAINTNNAWAVLPFGNYLFVADGGDGIKIIDISNPSSLDIIASLPTSGSAKDLSLSANYLFVAVGANGVDMIDVSNPENPIFISNYNTSGYASRVSANDSLVAVSDWDDVEVLGFKTRELILKGFKNTGGRTMAIAMKDNDIFSAEWFVLNMFKYEHIDGPDIDFSKRKIEFDRVNTNSQKSQTMTIANNGHQELNILNVDLSDTDFTIDVPFNVLSPGEIKEISVTYSPINNIWRRSVMFSTNDSDENLAHIVLQGNFPYGPMPGDLAPDFNLPSVAKVNGRIDLQSLLGQPTVIAFFTAW